MGALSAFLRYELFFLLAALAVIVAYRMLTRQINMSGLLRDKVGGRAVSPGRLQMLIVTLVVAVYYVAEVLGSEKLPELPREFMLALAGSHLVYLGGKFYALLASKFEFAVARMAGDRVKSERRMKR